jgi:sulfane dehydrogenase subunit SoxC
LTTLDTAAAEPVATPPLTTDELGLATRNHGFLLEALRYPVTPLGLHYLLIHYDIPMVDPASWVLEIGGAVDRPLRLTLEELRTRPVVTQQATMECAGNGRMQLTPRAISQPWGVEAVGNAEWTGTRLWPLLEEAGLAADAVEVVFSGLDKGVENNVEQRYERSLTLDEARRDEVILAYAVNGVPLPPQHGFPLRLIVPGWYGMTNVKWLSEITVVDRPFEGYQNAHAYRMRLEADEQGEPLSRIRPRSLMVPPGFPDFMTRKRFLSPGPTPLEGRAWSGHAPIARVEVSTDGGGTWTDAVLETQSDPYAWVGWSAHWDAQPGEHELCVRATDAAGNTQPLEGEWNLGGYACNTVHRVSATVAPG